jgi:hypothetical protein
MPNHPTAPAAVPPGHPPGAEPRERHMSTAGLGWGRTTPLTCRRAARMVPHATSRREVGNQRGSSAGTPAIAGNGSRWAERSS